MWGILSDERTDLSFATATGPRQCSHSQVRVPWDSRPHFTVSYLRLPFLSLPTTRRVTVEVFDPVSTQVLTNSFHWFPLHSLSLDQEENTASKNSSTVVLNRLLPSDGPGTADVGVCFGCCRNVFIVYFLAMGNFSGPTILTFSHYVTI
jgi:hypothetical protein